MPEASKVPPGWHGWLHHNNNNIPNNQTNQEYHWQRQHLPNLSGTVHLKLPTKYIYKSKNDTNNETQYNAWAPKSNIVEKISGVNIPKKDCMWLHKCSGVFKGGPNKGQRCNKPCNDFMCSQHIKQLDKNNNIIKRTTPVNINNQTCNKCNATNLNGKKCKKTGKNCVTISVDDIEYKKYLCTTHNNKYLKFKDSWDNYDLKIYFT